MSIIDEIYARSASECVQGVLDILDGVSETSNGWQACCPAHDDEHPSLSIAEGTDGRVLLYCHAGCDIESIVDALGLAKRDLFPRRSRWQGER